MATSAALLPWSDAAFSPRADVVTMARRYLQPMSGGPLKARTTSDEARRLVPLFALAVAIIAVSTASFSALDLVMLAIPIAAFGIWGFRSRVPLVLAALAVLVPVVLVQRSGAHEPAMFEVSVLGFVVACWSESLARGGGARRCSRSRRRSWSA